MEHINIPAGEIHQPHNWQWADQTARLAEVVTDSFLVGRFGLQVSDGTLWRLASTSPAVWAPVAHYEHPANHPPSIITQDAINRFVTDAEKSAWNAKQAALGFTPENAANRGAVNGYVPLDADSRVPAAYLPSYVDDVLEFADLAALPATGETGKIYTTLDNGKIYRWGGSAYAEISPSPGSTDAVPEGVTNLYHTAARVRDVLLTGLSTATNAVITAADSVLSALGKLQKQISDWPSAVMTLTNKTITDPTIDGVKYLATQSQLTFAVDYALDQAAMANKRVSDATTFQTQTGTASFTQAASTEMTRTYATATVTLPKAFKNTDYQVVIDPVSATPALGFEGQITVQSRSVNSFVLQMSGSATACSVRWKALHPNAEGRAHVVLPTAQ